MEGLPPRKSSEIFSKSHQGYSGIRNNSKPYKFALPADKKGIFNISAQIEETETTIETGIQKFHTKLRTFQFVGDIKKTVIFGKIN